MSVWATQVVPTNVEKIPLYHWCPGARLLCVGGRDGAYFDGRADDQGSYQREISPDLLRTAYERAGTDGVAATWPNSLLQEEGLELLASLQVPLVVACSGHGPAAVVERWLPHVDAWSLLVDVEAGEQVDRILNHGKHVEIWWAGDAEAHLPHIAWPKAKAVHLLHRGAADTFLQMAQMSTTLNLWWYTDKEQHTPCPRCDETWVWRHAGRSRLDAIDPVTSSCTGCGYRDPNDDFLWTLPTS